MLGGEDGEQSGGESELWMAKEMDSILHCRFTALNPSWYYSKWRSLSSAVVSKFLTIVTKGSKNPFQHLSLFSQGWILRTIEFRHRNLLYESVSTRKTPIPKTMYRANVNDSPETHLGVGKLELLCDSTFYCGDFFLCPIEIWDAFYHRRSQIFLFLHFCVGFQILGSCFLFMLVPLKNLCAQSVV